MKNTFLKWFSTKVMKIISIERKMTRDFTGICQPILDELDKKWYHYFISRRLTWRTWKIVQI